MAGRARCADAVRAMVASYRTHMREYARMPALDAWYSHIDVEIFVEKAKTFSATKSTGRKSSAARYSRRPNTSCRKSPRFEAARRRIIDHPPLIYHPRELWPKLASTFEPCFTATRLTLPEERRVILDRYHIVDIARKVVGVGSVGTRCDVDAAHGRTMDDAILLQLKEALPSVLEPYAGKSRYPNHGERVVTGQRMLQSASDVFLGWTRDDDGHDYYFRQLARHEDEIRFAGANDEVGIGWNTCRSADGRWRGRMRAPATRPRIGGYLGKNAKFDEPSRNLRCLRGPD